MAETKTLTFGEAIQLYGFAEAVRMLREALNRTRPAPPQVPR